MTNDLRQSRRQIANRLKRAEGHVRRIVTMFEEQRPCLDIAQQMKAVEMAIMNAKRSLVRNHLDECFESVIGHTQTEARAPIDTLEDLLKYL